AKKSYDPHGNPTKVIVVKDIPQEKQFLVSSKTTVPFGINVYSFPGWNVFVDNHLVNYTDSNPLKLITIMVPSGNHTVVAQFEDTPLRVFSNILSLISLIVVLLGGLLLFKKGGKHETRTENS